MLVKDGDAVAEGQVLVILDSSEAVARVLRAEIDLDVSRNALHRLSEELQLLKATNRNRIKETELAVKRAESELQDQIGLWEVSQNVGAHLSADDSTSKRRQPVLLREKRVLLEQAQLALSHARDLVSEERIKDIEIENARKAVASAQAEAEFAVEAVTRTRIVAHRSGCVQGCNLDELSGTYVSAGQPLFKIVDATHWSAVGYATERDLPKIKTGLDAELYIQAYPYEQYRTFEGCVAGVSTSYLQSGSEVVKTAVSGNLYPVEIRITDEELTGGIGPVILRDGLNAEVKVIVRRDRIITLLLEKLFSTARRLKDAPIEAGS